MSDQKKKQNLFLILTGVFLTNAILAEIIGIKIFSAEKTFGFEPANIQMMGDFILDFNLTAGVVIWPVVFLSTDVINEYFGKKGVQKISFLTVALIAYSFLIIYVITLLAPADFWIAVNQSETSGKDFNINFAFTKVFTQSLGVIIGSMVAFLIGQLLDVLVFQKLRKITGENKIWLRATGSTLVSQLVDSFVVLFIAFYLLSPAENKWSFDQLISVGGINYIYKFVVAISLTPLIYLAHFLIDKYLGPTLASELKEEASLSS